MVVVVVLMLVVKVVKVVEVIIFLVLRCQNEASRTPLVDFLHLVLVVFVFVFSSHVTEY